MRPRLTLHLDELQVRAILQLCQVARCAVSPGALLPLLLQLQLQLSNLKKERLISETQPLNVLNMLDCVSGVVQVIFLSEGSGPFIPKSVFLCMLWWQGLKCK